MPRASPSARCRRYGRKLPVEGEGLSQTPCRSCVAKQHRLAERSRSWCRLGSSPRHKRCGSADLCSWCSPFLVLVGCNATETDSLAKSGEAAERCGAVKARNALSHRRCCRRAAFEADGAGPASRSLRGILASLPYDELVSSATACEQCEAGSDQQSAQPRYVISERPPLWKCRWRRTAPAASRSGCDAATTPQTGAIPRVRGTGALLRAARGRSARDRHRGRSQGG